MFAVPSLLSVFYASGLTIVYQLTLAHHIQPAKNWAKKAILFPLLLALTIGIATISSGSYGFYEPEGYCWYKSEGRSLLIVFITMILTFDAW
jgi:hypothetical protein